MGEDRGGRVDGIHAQPDRFERAKRPEAGEAVGVELERHGTDGRPKHRNQRPDPFRLEKPAGILQEHGIDPQPDQLARLAGIVVVRVDRADRVDDPGRHVEPGRLGRPHGDLQVPDVIQRVIGRRVPDAVRGNPPGRQLDHVVGKELEREEALAAGHHDQRCFRDHPAHDPHPLPRVLEKVPDADVEHCAPHQVDGLEAQPIQVRRDGKHHRGSHPGGPEGLVGVPERGVDERDFPHAALTSTRFTGEARSPSGSDQIPRWPRSPRGSPPPVPCSRPGSSS